MPLKREHFGDNWSWGLREAGACEPTRFENRLVAHWARVLLGGGIRFYHLNHITTPQ